MIRMGLDASTKCSGWCIFDDDKLIEYGKISPDDNSLTWRERIIWMMHQVALIIKRYNVEELIAETPVKTTKNVNTLEQLFSLHGAILGIATVLHIKFVPVDVNQWRKSLGLLKDIPKDVSDKRAVLKKRSIEMANDIYNLDLVWKSSSSKFNDDDISDSILIATVIIRGYKRGE